MIAMLTVIKNNDDDDESDYDDDHHQSDYDDIVTLPARSLAQQNSPKGKHFNTGTDIEYKMKIFTTIFSWQVC